MATMNISLPDPMRAFVEEEIAAGGYSTASEYFRELVRERQRQKHQERLDALLLEGLESGEATPMTPDDWAAVRREVAERITERQRGSSAR